MLEGDFVRTKRTWNLKQHKENFLVSRSGPRAYQFHTSILGVNRAVKSEAEELLYKRNVFVVLSYQYHGLGIEIGGLAWLPIVSNKHVRKFSDMQKHSLRIHVAPGISGAQRLDPSATTTSTQSAIILAQDLDAFCLIMTSAGSVCTKESLAVVLSKDSTGTLSIVLPDAVAKKAATPQFICELFNTEYCQIDTATQHQLLSPMARILAPSQRAAFKGPICDVQQVNHLKQLMSPSLLCISAYNWSRFKTMSLAKDVADATLHLDDIEFTMNLYIILAIRLAQITFTEQNDPPADRQDYLAQSPEAADACDILRMETLVSAACCAVKARDFAALRRASAHITQVFVRRSKEQEQWRGDLAPLDTQLIAHGCTVLLWQHLYGEEPVYGGLTIKDAVDRLRQPGHGMYEVHDAEILSRQPDQEALVTREHLPIDQCSAFQLPVLLTSLHKPLLEQDRFKGWLDLDLLHSLHEGQKKDINNLQKQFRIKVTAFDELLQ